MKIHTLPVVIFTIWTDPSTEPVRAIVEVEFIAKHVNPSVWYGWPIKVKVNEKCKWECWKYCILCI